MVHLDTTNVLDRFTLFDTQDECSLADSSKQGRIDVLTETFNYTDAFHVIAIRFQIFGAFLGDLISVDDSSTSSVDADDS